MEWCNPQIGQRVETRVLVAFACALLLVACLFSAVPAYAGEGSQSADDADGSAASAPATETHWEGDDQSSSGSSAVVPANDSASGVLGASADAAAASSGTTRYVMQSIKSLTSGGKIVDASDPASSSDAVSKVSAATKAVADAAKAGKTSVHASPLPTVPNPTTEQFIAAIGDQAREIADDAGLYASVMIAQAILESGSGSSGLSKPPYNNLFGIKGSYKGSAVYMMTQEDDGTGRYYDILAAFRRYPSTRESLQDYADLLTVTMASFYAPAWKANAKTYAQACDYLQGHYATSTTYSASLQGLIIAYDLERFDHPADADGRAAADADHAKAMFVAVSPRGDGAYATPSAEASRDSQASHAGDGDQTGQARSKASIDDAADQNREAFIAFAKSPAGQAAAFAICPVAVVFAGLLRRGFAAVIAFR